MKKTRIILAAALLLAGTSAVAQDFRTGYFLDNFAYSYRLNPSLQPNDTRIVFGGVLCNIGVSPEMNFGLGDVVFPSGGKLVLGLNSAIPSSQFPSKLPTSALENLRVNENIFTFGWQSKKDSRIFHSVEVNLRANESANIPRSLFEFLKIGGQGNTYNVNDMKVRVNGFGEIAYGFSLKNEHWSFGGRLKALIGITNVTADIEKMVITVGNDNASISGQGTLYSADAFLKLKSNPDETIKFGVEKGTMSPGGFGAALDLGATWQSNGLSISLGVTDLGMMSWSKKGTHASFSAGTTVIDQETIKNDISSIFKFKKDNGAVGGMTMLPMTVNAGVRYHMPFWQGLSVGALGTYRVDGVYSWYEGRAGITVSPIKAICITGNYAFTSFGNTYGAAVSFRIPGVNLYVGLDSVPTSISKQFIPIEKLGAMCVNAGLVLAFK